MPNNNRLVLNIFVEGSNRSIVMAPLNAVMPTIDDEIEKIHGNEVRHVIGKAVLSQIMMEISLPGNQERYAKIIGEKILNDLDPIFAIPSWTERQQ